MSKNKSKSKGKVKKGAAKKEELEVKKAPQKKEEPGKKTKLSKAELLAELAESNDFFDMLVDMIPSKLYVKDSNPDSYNPRFQKKHAQKDSKEARRAQAKLAKRRKLDPEQSQGTAAQAAAGAPTALPSAPPKTTNTTTNTNMPGRMEDLRAKLQARIEAKQAHRKLNPTKDPDAAAAAVSKRAARREEKARRQAEARQKKKSKTETSKAQGTAYTTDSKSPKAPDAADDLEHVDFGRLAGLNPDQGKPYSLHTNKALANLGKSKNLQKLVAQAEAKQAKRQALLAAGDTGAVAKQQWSDVLHEADGQRVKDDPVKLQKQLQKRQAKKRKSQKAWQTRREQVQQAVRDRQNIRTHNLQQRKQGGSAGANLSKKRIETTAEGKEGRRRAGFEGRKQEFLNHKVGGGGKE